MDDILALLLLGVITSFARGRVNLFEPGLTSLMAVCFIRRQNFFAAPPFTTLEDFQPPSPRLAQPGRTLTPLAR